MDQACREGPRRGPGSGIIAPYVWRTCLNTPLLPPRYELLGPLGEGGMGVVSWVLDRETGREVALKQLRVPEGQDASQARFLFRQEFWSMTSLRHPNLVEALDFGEGPD